MNVKMTYFQHLFGTIVLSVWCLLISLVFFIHGIFPSILEETGSNELQKISRHILDLHSRISEEENVEKIVTVARYSPPPQELPLLYKPCPLKDLSFRDRNFSI